MTLNQLRSFAAVAASGSVRQAAEALYVSAPAVSAAVGALESELGLPLVSRLGRGLELTPAGVVFARYARQVLGLLEEGIAATACVPSSDESAWRPPRLPGSTSFPRS